eukprot:1404520-Amphidinium_carterae.1
MKSVPVGYFQKGKYPKPSTGMLGMGALALTPPWEKKSAGYGPFLDSALGLFSSFIFPQHCKTWDSSTAIFVEHCKTRHFPDVIFALKSLSRPGIFG